MLDPVIDILQDHDGIVDHQPDRQNQGEEGQAGRRGFTQQQLEAVEATGGRMPKTEMLRYRIRYFTLGTAAFIKQVFQRNRSNLGPSREAGARRMHGADWGELHVIRDLYMAVVNRPR